MPRPYVLAIAFGLTILSILATRPAFAVVVLDQQNDLTGSAAADTTSGGFLENAQTFTPGVTGTLDRIEAQIVRFFGSGGNAILSVYNTSGGLPTGASLGAKTLAWNSIPTTGYAYQVFDFSDMAIPITAGTVMAYGVSSTTDGALGGLRSSFDQSTYPGGEAKFRQTNPNGPWQNFNFSHDYGFKIYVDAAAPVATPGDFNDDGTVNAADYPVWRKYLDDPSEAALNGNGNDMNGVDEGDYNLWRENFAEGGSGGSAPVPEPRAGILCLIAALVAMPTTRRGRVR